MLVWKKYLGESWKEETDDDVWRTKGHGWTGCWLRRQKSSFFGCKKIENFHNCINLLKQNCYEPTWPHCMFLSPSTNNIIFISQKILEFSSPKTSFLISSHLLIPSNPSTLVSEPHKILCFAISSISYSIFKLKLISWFYQLILSHHHDLLIVDSSLLLPSLLSPPQ